MDDALFELLKIFNSHDFLSINAISQMGNLDIHKTAEYVSELLDCNYLHLRDFSEAELRFNSKLRITAKGQIALYSEIKSRKRFKFSELRAWITLAIALMSLVVLSLINTFAIFA